MINMSENFFKEVLIIVSEKFILLMDLKFLSLQDVYCIISRDCSYQGLKLN